MKQGTKGIPHQVWLDLQDSSLTLPYTFSFLDSNTNNNDSATNSATTTTTMVTVRHLERKDLSSVVPMCVREFGAQTTTTTTTTTTRNNNDVVVATNKNKNDKNNPFTWNTVFRHDNDRHRPHDNDNDIDDASNRGRIPFWNPKSFESWLDAILFRPTVYLSFLLKIIRREQGYDDSFPDILPDYNVLCLEVAAGTAVQTPSEKDTTTTITTATTAKDDDDDTEAVVVGIVELSIQPLDPERNPPPIPLPLWYKEAYCQSKAQQSQSQQQYDIDSNNNNNNIRSTITTITTTSSSSSRMIPPRPNGWVTNLLVDSSVRGKGYSKVLMMAVEGLAKQWNCTSISLHVDANTNSGRIPQRLYDRLGYKPVFEGSTTTSTTTTNNGGGGTTTTRNKNIFDWMGPTMMIQSGIYIVDGVPLLFLQKELYPNK